MRKFKTLGLAVIAVLAFSMLAGAGNASATTVCAAQGTTVAPCPTGFSPYSGSITTTLTNNATFTSSFMNITCNQSMQSGTTNSSGVGSITASSWTNNGGACPNNVGGTCTSTASNLPWAATDAFDAAHTNGRDDSMVFVPKVTIVCSTFVGTVTCHYTGNNASAGGAGTLTGDTLNGTPSMLTFPASTDTKANLALDTTQVNSGSCTSPATFSATYDIYGLDANNNEINLWVTA